MEPPSGLLVTAASCHYVYTVIQELAKQALGVAVHSKQDMQNCLQYSLMKSSCAMPSCLKTLRPDIPADRSLKR